MRKFVTVAFLAAGLLCGCPEGAKTGTDTTKPPETKTPDGKTPETKTPEAGKTDTKAENFWKDAGVGTVVEYKMVTEAAGTKTEMTQKQTLKSKDDKGYVLTNEMKMGETAMPATDMPMEWPKTGPATDAKPDPATKDMGDEDVKVGGDTLKCKHWKTDKDGTVTETWMHKGTLMVKMNMTGPTKMTNEMTKLEKK